MSDAQSRWVAPARMPPPRPARWREIVSAAMLLLALAIVAVTASPVIFRAAGLTRTATTARGVDSRQDPQTALGAGDRADRRPVFTENDDELSPHDDLQRLYPQEGNWPGKRRREEESAERAAGAQGVPGAASSSRVGKEELRLGLAEKALRLRDRPSEGSTVTGVVAEGEMVMILKESDGWVLVVHGGSNAGWTRRSEIAVR